MKHTIAYTLVNGGTRYECYGLKKTRHGRTCLFKTPAGNWIVANGVNWDSGIINGEVWGDWDYGHYFMDDEAEARRYFQEVA